MSPAVIPIEQLGGIGSIGILIAVTVLLVVIVYNWWF